MEITNNKEGEKSDRKETSQWRVSFVFIFIVTFVTLAFLPTNSRAWSESSLRIIYGGNLLGTIKPCG